MTPISISDFRGGGPPPGAFSRWLLSLEAGTVTVVPRRFADVPAKNVSGKNAAIRKAGIRAHFRTIGAKRYVYTEIIEDVK